MARKNKIKRYGKIYRSHNRNSKVSLSSVIVTVTIVALLALIGTVIYEPVYNFLMNYSNSSNSPGISEILGTSSVSEPTSSMPTSSSQAPEVVKTEYHTRGLYVQTPSLKANVTDITKLIESYKQYNINEIVIDLKDNDGNILYKSDLEVVKTTGSQAATAIDLAQFTSIAKNNGIKVIGVVSAFCDPIAPRKLKDSSIKYMQTEFNWLDKAAEAGGKPWLNPYSPNAQQYIADIAGEAAAKGVETVIISNANFPTVRSLERATFGFDSATVTKPAVLKSFINKVTTSVKANKGKVLMYTTAQELIGSGTEKYGDNPSKISTEIAASYMPLQFGAKFTFNDFILDKPLLTPSQTVDNTAKYVAKTVASNTHILPFVQGYTAAGISADSNKTYTVEDIKAQITALEQNNIKQFILVI